jgi:hypothetical protein
VAQEKIPERVREFIFNSVDSVELLEVLFLLRSHPNQSWTIESVNSEIRSSTASINQRLKFLVSLKLIEESKNDSGNYSYRPETSELESLTSDLFHSYQISRITVLELIFSPLKKARVFADAFRVSNSDKTKGRNND